MKQPPGLELAFLAHHFTTNHLSL